MPLGSPAYVGSSSRVKPGPGQKELYSPAPIGNTGPGQGGAAPPPFQPPQPPPGISFPNQPPIQSIGGPGGPPSFPGLGPPGVQPQPPEIPPPRPPVPMPGPMPQPQPPGQNISGPPEWMGGGIELAGGGFGQPGGQIGPPEQNQQQQGDTWGSGWDEILARMGYNLMGNPSSPLPPITDQQIGQQVPGLQQPAPLPRAPHQIGTSAGHGPEGMFDPRRGSPPGIGNRPPRGGNIGGRQFGPPMGGGMNWGPMPQLPGSITRTTGTGQPMFPPGTNPWDIPGAVTPGGTPIMPPGAGPGRFPDTPGGVIQENEEARRRLQTGQGTQRGGTPGDVILENQREVQRRRNMLK